MNAHVITRVGSLVEIEIRATKEMTGLDKDVLAYLQQLAQAGAEMQCRLFLHDGHLSIQLDHPSMGD